jgi:lysozyme
MISTKGLNLLAQFEGIELEAYPDPATGGEPITIGIGTTIYSSGRKVRLGDEITREQAYEYARHYLEGVEDKLDSLLKVKINQNQRDALLSFIYNLGIGNFRSSTLLRKVNQNPSNPTIRDEFMKWTKANGKVMNGLRIRRGKEADLYFS